MERNTEKIDALGSSVLVLSVWEKVHERIQ